MKRSRFYNIIRYLLFLISWLFSLSVYALDYDISWEPVVDPDLAGYRIYYDQGLPQWPFDGTGADQGTSPVVVLPGETSYTLTGLLDNEIYSFTVSWYDSTGTDRLYFSGQLPGYRLFGPSCCQWERTQYQAPLFQRLPQSH